MNKNISPSIGVYNKSVNLYNLIVNICFGLLIFINTDAKAQQPKQASNQVKALVTSLDSFRNRAPVEKVHVHFDKPYYSLGDTIWMKAYVVNSSNELSALSSILYVDLVNDQNIVKSSLRLPLYQGLGWGTIALTDSLLQAGGYHVHAYTNWMRNFGTDYFFDKIIRIGNAQATQKGGSNITNKQASTSAGATVQFFPEGGDLVNDIPSKVAFKAVGPDGMSREISGYVVDKNNQQVATFRSEHAGMGAFMLSPAAGNSYMAVIKFTDGTENRVELPKAMPQGYVFSVMQDAENINVKINVSSGVLQTGKILLVAQANNMVQYAAEKALISTGFTTVIPKSRFPEGILQLTLFSPNYQPVAERLVFINHDDRQLKINITTDKQAYNKRGKVHLSVSVTDNTGSPVVGDFSMSVTDETKVPYAEANETTVFSNLLLTSDLKGYIEQPNYYFINSNDNTNHQLDNLLLTQGWRRFLWKDIMTNNFSPLTYKSEKGINLTGTVFKSKNTVANARVSILVNDGQALLDTVSNAEGRFTFENIILKKGSNLKIVAETAKGNKNLTVQLDQQQPNPAIFEGLPLQQPMNNDLATYLKNERERLNEMDKYGLNERTIQLKEVKIKDIAVKNSASLAGAGNADQVLTFLDLAHCQYDLATCLQGRLTNIHFSRDSAGNLVPYSRNYDFPMLVVIDGVQGRELSSIMSSEVASIEVLRGGGASSLYGMHAGNGVLLITTKKGDVDYTGYEDKYYNPQTKPFSKNIFNGGYDLRRQFYAPDYDNPATNKEMADLRTTIYWEPNIMSDETGKASVNFFNADGTGNYRVTIEGMDIQGRLARQVYHYTVKQ